MNAHEPINALLVAALAAAAEGYHVFPCLPNKKEPAVKAWQKLATTDPDQIKKWWQQNPDFNIGVVPALSGCYVLDQDGPVGGEGLARLERDHGSLPDTLMVRTPSGPSNFHRWYAGECPNSVGTLAEKVDTRGRSLDGRLGYALLPPSRTQKGGYEYVLLLGMVMFFIALAGGRRYSLDRLISKEL